MKIIVVETCLWIGLGTNELSQFYLTIRENSSVIIHSIMREKLKS